MWHLIRFEVETLRQVEIGKGQPCGQQRIAQFSRLRGQVRPYVDEGLAGPREMANIDLENGTTLLEVPMSYFEFVDDE